MQANGDPGYHWLQVQELMLKMEALRRYNQRVTTGGVVQSAFRYSRVATTSSPPQGGRYGQHSTTAEALQAALYSGVAAITISN